MPKQRPRSGPGLRANGKEPGKEIVIDDRVRIAMGVLTAEEKIIVSEVLASPNRLRRLVKRAKLAGSDGQFLVADLTAGLRIVFRETPTQIRAVELWATQAFDDLGIQLVARNPIRAAKEPDSAASTHTAS